MCADAETSMYADVLAFRRSCIWYIYLNYEI